MGVASRVGSGPGVGGHPFAGAASWMTGRSGPPLSGRTVQRFSPAGAGTPLMPHYPCRVPFDGAALPVLGRCHISTCTARQAEGGVTVAAIERSRIRRTLLACTLGSTLPALCLAQTAQTAGMPPLPPLARTAALAAAVDPSHFTFVVAGDDRPATETATPTATIVE